MIHMFKSSQKKAFLLDRWTSRTWIPQLERGLRDWHAAIERDLKPAKRAREEGRDNRPHSDDTDPDVTQQQIIARFAHGAQALRQALANQIEGARQLIAERRPATLDPNIAAEEARLAANHLRDLHREPLITARKTERDKWRDLQLFKRENGLARSARYPDARIFALMTVALAMFAETVLNAFVFAQASVQGLVGGFVLALLFSLVNVVGGFVVLGRMLLPFVFHARLSKRLAAGAMVLPVVAGAVFWNLLVARYRDLIEANPERGHDVITTMPDVLASVWAAPFDLRSIYSVALLAAGLFVFLVAAIDGWRFYDDPYAGYGAHDREHKKAQEAYEAAKTAYRKALAAALGEIAAALAGRLATEDKQAHEVRDIGGDVGRRLREGADSAADLARACTTHLRRYREENTAVRTTPVPAYFSDYPDFEVTLPDGQDVQAALEATLGAIVANQAAGQAARRAIREAEQAELRELLGFVDGIEAEADRRQAEETEASRGKNAGRVE